MQIVPLLRHTACSLCSLYSLVRQPGPRTKYRMKFDLNKCNSARSTFNGTARHLQRIECFMFCGLSICCPFIGPMRRLEPPAYASATARIWSSKDAGASGVNVICGKRRNCCPHRLNALIFPIELEECLPCAPHAASASNHLVLCAEVEYAQISIWINGNLIACNMCNGKFAVLCATINKMVNHD